MIEAVQGLVPHASLSHYFQAIATLVPLVNPVVCAMMFTGIVRGRSQTAAFRAATVAVLTVGFVLIVAAFAGSSVLKLFGISLDAFSVAGGLVLMFIGFSMLQRSATGPGGSAQDGGTSAGLDKLILFAASPGTITGVITITAAQTRDAVPVTAIVAIVVVLAVTWLVLLAASMRGAAKRPGIAREMVSRYMGLIIIAMGIQFALTGYKAFMTT